MKSRTKNVFFCLFLITVFKPVQSEYSIEQLDKIVKDIQNLPKRNKPPRSFQFYDCKRVGKEFKPQDYFKVFKHISFDKKHILDFKYKCHDNGYPELYARKIGCEDSCYEKEVSKLVINNTNRRFERNNLYISKIIRDSTDLAYIETSILFLLGDQFYLTWHANYNDTKIVFNKKKLNKLNLLGFQWYKFKIPKEFFNEANKLDYHPKVTKSDSTATVFLKVFSKWNGITEIAISFSTYNELQVINLKSIVLVPYDCGMRF